MTLKQKIMNDRMKKALRESKRIKLLEARGKGIGDAFNTIYKQLAIQLQAEQAQEMEQWKKLLAAHQEKMEDIKRRRAEALKKFREAQSQLNAAASEVDIDDQLEDIATNAPDFDE